jgi:hypothetical protein
MTMGGAEPAAVCSAPPAVLVDLAELIDANIKRPES